MEEFWKEAGLVSNIRNHSNIVQFFGICLNPLCVVTEFMERGNLRSYLDDLENKIDHKQMIQWFQQIALGKEKKKIEINKERKKKNKNFPQKINHKHKNRNTKKRKNRIYL